MAMQASPKAGRKKVRCPRCTAFFSEPAKAVFECPICSCRLEANGANALTESPSHQTREGESGHRKAVLGDDKPIKMQSPIGSGEKVGNGMAQKGMSINYEQDSVASHAQLYKKREQTTMGSSHIFANGNTGGQASVGSSTIESLNGKDGMLGAYPPFHSASKLGNYMNGKENRELMQQLAVGVNEEATLVSTTGQHYSDYALQESSPTVREENNLIATGEEGIEGQDCVINGVSSNRHLQSQIFRTSRCEFSFKYSLEGASPLQSDGDLLNQKRSPNDRIVSSDTTMPKTEASDMPLHTPLRVRISKSHEESSDQSERGRDSFGFETDSDGTSGSDFDFPAPWAEGPQEPVLPAPFSQNEVFHPKSETIVSAAPHQLELQDDYDTIEHEKFTLQEELEKHLQVHGILQPNEKNHVLFGPPDTAEIITTEVKPPSSHTQSLDECAEGGEEQEAGLKESFQQEKLRNTDPTTNVQQEACKRLDVLAPSGGGLDLAMNDHFNRKQESAHAEKKDFKTSSSIRDANLKNPATLHDPEYLKPKQSAPNPDHTDHFDETCSISNTRGFQMGDLQGIYEKEPFHNHQKVEGLSSRMSKIEQSSVVANARDSGTANHHVSSSLENTEQEEDLYKLPHEIYRKDSLLGKCSGAAVWAEEETDVSSLSDGTFVSISKAKLHHEKTNTQKSSHAKLHGNMGSRIVRSDNSEDHFMSGEAKNLRRLAASREGSLQATPKHVEWEGHITAVEDHIGHPDLHGMEGKRGPYSQYPMNNTLGFPQPYAFTNHHYGFGTSGTNQIYPYPLPSQSLMHPAAFQNHASGHCGYHAMSPSCILCSYHQHAHMQPQHIPHCGACFGQSGSTSYNAGLVENWDCHQANLGSASSCAGSLVEYPQACSSSSLIQRYDIPNAESGSQASSAKKYPPFPKVGAAPYVTCKGCTRVLQVPSNLPPNEGAMQKLRCGACGKVTKFSANYYGQQRGVVSSTLPSPPELNSMGGIANSSPSLVHYGAHSRQQLPLSSATERTKSSYKPSMIKENPVLHGSNAVSLQSNNIAASRISEHNPRGGEFFRVQPGGHTMDASHNNYGRHDPSISVSTRGPAHLQNASSVVGAMSPRNVALRSTETFGFEKLKVNHLTVDEKEEGLDFGAPRISDGDSLDHSESRMRSPEYNQACHETAHMDTSQGAPIRGCQPLEQVSDLSEDYGPAAQETKPGSPLLVLLNQESTRFSLNLEPSLPFEGSKSALRSPVSDSSVYASSLHNHPQKTEQDYPRSHGSPGQHFVSKGHKYIAGLLRRSLRDSGKGGQ